MIRVVLTRLGPLMSSTSVDSLVELEFLDRWLCRRAGGTGLNVTSDFAFENPISSLDSILEFRDEARDPGETRPGWLFLRFDVFARLVKAPGSDDFRRLPFNMEDELLLVGDPVGTIPCVSNLAVVDI
jgi:hypothetical protein